MREIVRMVTVLTLICGISGFSLSYVRKVTEEPIQSNLYRRVLGPALDDLFPEKSNDPVAERKEFAWRSADGGPEERMLVFPVRRGGKLWALAFEAKGRGYKGEIGMMLGVDLAANQLVGLRVTGCSETPGLGALIKEPGFTGQFSELSIFGAIELGRSIQAVSGATVSSRAVCAGASRSLERFRAHRDEIVAVWAGTEKVPPQK